MQKVHTRRVTMEINYTDPPVGPNFLNAGFLKRDTLIPKNMLLLTIAVPSQGEMHGGIPRLSSYK